MDLEESGEIIFKDQNYLKWTYLDPDFKVFLLKDRDYRYYDRENEQLSVGRISENDRMWIWQLLFSDELLPYIRVDREGRKIFIKKQQADESLDVEIHLNKNHLPYKVIQEDTNLNVRYIFLFSDYKENITIPGNALELTVPDDVEIING